MDIHYSITEQLNKARVGNTYKVIVDSFDHGMYNGRAYLILPRLTAE